jgi:hypothetical protein
MSLYERLGPYRIVFQRCTVRISDGIVAILPEDFVLFLSPSMQIP